MLWRASRLRLFFCFIMTCAIVNILMMLGHTLTCPCTLQQQHMLDCSPCSPYMWQTGTHNMYNIAANNVCIHLQCLLQLSVLLPANVTKGPRSVHTSAMLAMRVCVSGRRYRKRPAVSNSPQAVSTLCWTKSSNKDCSMAQCQPWC